MENTENLNPETTTETKTALKLLPGDKDRYDWLNGLTEGTVFLARPRQGNPKWLLTEFLLDIRIVDGNGISKAVKLATNMDTNPTAVWVDPVAFSVDNLLIKILIEGTEDNG